MIAIKLKAIAAKYRNAGRVKDEGIADFSRLFPVDSGIEWDMGGHTQSGTVVMHSMSHARVKVCNAKSGKEYWIEHYNVLVAYGVGDCLFSDPDEVR